MIRRLLDAMQTHDDNEDRRYLYEGQRWNLCWTWAWFTWSIGAAVSLDRHGSEPFMVSVALGPFAIEVYYYRGSR